MQQRVKLFVRGSMVREFSYLKGLRGYGGGGVKRSDEGSYKKKKKKKFLNTLLRKREDENLPIPTDISHALFFFF